MNDANYSVVIETHGNLHEYIDVIVKNSTLSFEYKKIKRYDVMRFYISAPDIKKIKASGASDVVTPETIKGDDLKIIASGATEAKLKLDYNSVFTKISGASEVTLQGKAT